MNKNKNFIRGRGKSDRGREVGLEGEGSWEEKWGERGREVGIGYPLPTPFLMPDIKISEAGILNLLKNLIPKKAAGPDRIKPVILQELRVKLAPTIKVLFERSLESVAVLHIWNSANVSPIFKKGDKSTAANYRDISLTCILYKVMEHIIASKIRHLDSNGLMYDLQHGFRERGSCETLLVSLIEDLARTTSQDNRPISYF